MIEAHQAVNQQFIRQIHLQIDVTGIVVPAQPACKLRRITGKTVRADRYRVMDRIACRTQRTGRFQTGNPALDNGQVVIRISIDLGPGNLEIKGVSRGVRSYRKRQRVTFFDRIPLATVFKAESGIQRAGKAQFHGQTEIGVHGKFIINQIAGSKARRRLRPQGRIECVGNSITNFVRTIAHRQVQSQTVAQFSPQAAHHAVIDHFPGKLRREPRRVQSGAGVVDGAVFQP